MKIIDLLNKVLKKEEVPSAVRWNGETYIYNSKYNDYESKFNIFLFYSCVTSITGDLMIENLNDEVEILDEPKVGKLNLEKKEDGFLYLHGNKIVNQDFTFALKINEIIDEINKLKEK